MLDTARDAAAAQQAAQAAQSAAAAAEDDAAGARAAADADARASTLKVPTESADAAALLPWEADAAEVRVAVGPPAAQRAAALAALARARAAPAAPSTAHWSPSAEAQYREAMAVVQEAYLPPPPPPPPPPKPRAIDVRLRLLWRICMRHTPLDPFAFLCLFRRR
jgi:hypothetical protein